MICVPTRLQREGLRKHHGLSLMSLFMGEGGEFSSHTGSLSEGSLSSPQEILIVVINKGYVVLNTGHTCEVTYPQLEDPLWRCHHLRKMETKVVSKGLEKPPSFRKETPKDNIVILGLILSYLRGLSGVSGLEASLLTIPRCKVALLINNAHCQATLLASSPCLRLTQV